MCVLVIRFSGVLTRRVSFGIPRRVLRNPSAPQDLAEAIQELGSAPLDSGDAHPWSGATGYSSLKHIDVAEEPLIPARSCKWGWKIERKDDEWRCHKYVVHSIVGTCWDYHRS